jgi:hypothetical protein
MPPPRRPACRDGRGSQIERKVELLREIVDQAEEVTLKRGGTPVAGRQRGRGQNDVAQRNPEDVARMTAHGDPAR